MEKKHGYTDQDRARYEKGLPDHHDPTAGIGGAAPAYSALSLRLVLAIVALLLAIGVAILGLTLSIPALYWSMFVLVVIVIIDIVVILRRKRRGEPG